MSGKQENVVRSLAKGRQIDDDALQAEEEIGPEL
jgi:hypothetical protein